MMARAPKSNHGDGKTPSIPLRFDPSDPQDAKRLALARRFAAKGKFTQLVKTLMQAFIDLEDASGRELEIESLSEQALMRLLVTSHHPMPEPARYEPPARHSLVSFVDHEPEPVRFIEAHVTTADEIGSNIAADMGNLFED